MHVAPVTYIHEYMLFTDRDLALQLLTPRSELGETLLYIDLRSTTF